MSSASTSSTFFLRRSRTRRLWTSRPSPRTRDWFYCEFIRGEDKSLVLKSFYKNYDFFSNKLFKGLEFKKGADIKKFELGKKGIAIGYEDIQDKEQVN
jgi:hypothetical protein